MEYRDYKEKILDTVEFYSDNLKERILRDLIKQGVLTKDKQVDMLTQDALYINLKIRIILKNVLAKSLKQLSISKIGIT